MKVLSLFDGISCAMLALQRAGIPVECYDAFEIDKYAVTVSKRNFPVIVHHGNVYDGDFTQFKGYDLLLGGSPCTYWSIAKKDREVDCNGEGFRLFKEYVRALEESGCKYFLYENNYSVHQNIKDEISKTLGVEPIMINSALVSAQNRKRCYWTNIPNVVQPEDKGILLADVLEKRVITPDTYKDWNDMLRGIPKAVEHETEKKEVQQTDMQRYGNEMWHKATDNRDKSLVTIQAEDFSRLQEQLDNSGINYYAYARDNSVIMAINDKDVEWFKRIAGTPDLVPTKSNRPYSPPEKNIFGSAEYRYIPQKEYISADRDLVLKMAEIMAKRGMQFSGRVYPSGKGTLTVSHADLFAVRNIRDEVVNIEEMLLEKKKMEVKFKKACGKSYNKEFDGFICRDNYGNMISPGYVTQHFHYVITRNGLKHLRFHDLRHSCASLLLAHDVPMKAIQEWLGHSNFSITANLYSHLEYNAKVNSAETIARVLGGKSKDKHEAEKPAEKKKTTRRKSTSKAATKTPPKKTGGRKKKSDNPEGTGEPQMSTL